MSMLAQIRSNEFTLPTAFLYILLKCVWYVDPDASIYPLSLFTFILTDIRAKERLLTL